MLGRLQRAWVRVGTKLLADVVASRVLADFVNGYGMAAVTEGERHLPALDDGHFWLIEHMRFVYARVRIGADCEAERGRLPTWEGAERLQWHDAKFDEGLGCCWLSFREVEVLCPRAKAGFITP